MTNNRLSSKEIKSKVLQFVEDDDIYSYNSANNWLLKLLKNFLLCHVFDCLFIVLLIFFLVSTIFLFFFFLRFFFIFVYNEYHYFVLYHSLEVELYITLLTL